MHHFINYCSGNPSKSSGAQPLVYEKNLDKMDFTNPSSFSRIQEIVDPPAITFQLLTSSTDNLLQQLSPYLLQKIKMWGPHVIHPFNLNQLLKIKRENLTRAQSEALSRRPTFTRLDLINYWVKTLNPIVLQDLFRILSLFSLSLPLVIPWAADCDKDGDRKRDSNFKILIPLLRHCSYKWSRADRNNLVVESNLFVSKFKMIAAIRVGSGPVGKSSVLGTILKDTYAFSSVQESASQLGPPNSLTGTIEIIPLTEETCSLPFWDIVSTEHYNNTTVTKEEDEILLLANLHGDALDNQLTYHLDYLKQFCSTFVIFRMPDVPKKKFEKFKSKFENCFEIYIDPDEETMDLCEEISISTRELTRDFNVEKVREVFQSAIKKAKKQDAATNAQTIQVNRKNSNLSLVPELSTTVSIALVNEIKKMGCLKAKQLLNLQKSAPNPQSALHLIKSLEQFDGAPGVYSSLQMIVNSFLNILFLPIADRQISLVHMDMCVSKLSSVETSWCRQQLMENRKALQIKTNQEVSDKEITKLSKAVTDSYQEIDQKSLGVEHFIREVSTLYEGLMMTDDPSNVNSKYLETPKKVAELLLDGQPIEIFDGDEGTLSRCWFDSVMRHVCALNPKKENLRVFVVSVLGLQSSGKSTLLNSLFNCKFAVSAGRCTKGLFLRLLLLDPDYAAKVEFDALLLIDTEGLGSPEKKNDPVSDERDRKMATFVVSISNFTIINVLGETISPISEILQIVIVAIGRLRTAGLTPDLMMVQHTSEKNPLNRAAAHDEFRNSLTKAINAVTREPIKYRQQNVEAIKFLETNLYGQDLVEEFPSFKRGAGVGAPPTKEYHDHVVDLFTKIISRGKKNTSRFYEWHERVYDIWQCIKDDNFAMRFKDIIDMQEFHRRGDCIAKTQEKIMLALTEHLERIKTQLVQLVDQSVTKAGGVDEKNKQKNQIIERVEHFLYQCKAYGVNEYTAMNNSCQQCVEATGSLQKLYDDCEGKPYDREVNETMQKHKERCLHDAKNQLRTYYEAVEVERIKSSLIGLKITSYLKDFLGEQNTTGIPNEITRKSFADQIFYNLEKDLKEQTDMHFKSAIFKEITESSRFPVPGLISKLQSYPEEPWTGFYNANPKVLKRIKIKSRFFSDSLNDSQQEELLDEFKGLPSVFLSCVKLTRYERNRGLATELFKRIDLAISKFQDKWGTFNEISLVLEIAIRIFLQEMYKIEAAFIYNNSALGKFRAKARTYREQIETILKHGFSANADGQLCGDRIIQSVVAQAKLEAEKQHRERVMSLSWFSGVENLRLSYFTDIARQVQQKQYESAIIHFTKPQAALNSWIASKIDSYSGEKRLLTFKKYLCSEMESLVIQIRECKAFSEILELEQKHFIQSRLDRNHIAVPSQYDTNKENFGIFKQKVLEKLEPYKTKSKEVPVVFIKPSEDPLVLQRFGCTAACHFCGAICWGVRDHELNEDDTKHHHASHQPQGLALWHNKKTRILETKICHDESINDDLYMWGEFREKGLPWRETKIHPLWNNWLYTQHNNRNFDALMIWFFVHIHEKLAEHQDFKPAPADRVEALTQSLPNLNSILNEIENRIGGRQDTLALSLVMPKD